MPAVANLVHQSSTSTGTGSFTLDAVNGKQSFAQAFGVGATPNKFDYFISSQDAPQWERGTGHMSSATTLVRDTVLEGTNGTNPVNFADGVKDVVNDLPAALQVQRSQLGTAAAENVEAFASAAQGGKADTAVQPGALSAVATSGSYDDLTNKPDLGTDLTPEKYLCVGDGTTDDGTNFKSALDAAIAAGVDLVLTPGKTYLLSTWDSGGYTPSGMTRIRGADREAVIKGPSGGEYFFRPGTTFDISGVAFDRWTGVVRKDVADGGSIAGARFTDNLCTNITGIPFNIEIPLSDSYIERNKFENCSGGYVIRIGENTYGNQDNWHDNYVCKNIIRSVTASSTTSLMAILVYGRDSLVDGNDVDGLTSTNGEAIGIYVKLRGSQITNNKVRNVTSTGTSGAALDVVGISLKGAIRTVTNSGVQGRKNICANNQVRTIGAQGVKGTGIRCQISDSIVAQNIIQDVGLIGINVDDGSGSSFNKVLDNSIEGYSILGTYGVYLATFGKGQHVAGNSIVDFVQGVHIEGKNGTLLSTRINDNVISSTIASSLAFAFYGSNTVQGALITGNDVTLPSTGYVTLNNDTVTAINIRNNNFAPAIANGAGNLLGSATGITSASNP